MTSLSNLVEELRALHEKATPGEWTYRSNQHDDWGVVRGPSGYYVAQAHPGRRLTDEEANEHRQNKTDPHGPNALFIIAAHTHLPTLLSALEGEKEEGWRDIATAPKDHFPVLAWSIETGRVVAFQDITWTWWPSPASHPLSHPPTHWQPLPSPPVKP